MAPNHHHDSTFGLRKLTERLICFLVGLLLLRTWLVEGLLIPYRVTSGSMAQTLLGPHRSVTCGNCGHRFVCGAGDRQADAHAVCPNCHHVGRRLGTLPSPTVTAW